MNSELLGRIRQCPSLPSLPAIAIQILELAGKPDIDMAEIGRIISRDPALSTKILRTVNSGFYGRGQHVSTISHALVILGLQSVKTLVLGFSLVTSLTKSQATGFKRLQYWRRSIYAATACRTIANKMGLVQQEEAFLAGLLQDIGMLVLDQVLGSQYSDICQKATTHQEIYASEQAALGMTHAEVGALLAEGWKLPPILTQTIRASHANSDVADPSLRRLSQVVQLSGLCADVFVDDQPAAAIVQVRQFCHANYKMSEADCDTLLQEIAQTTKEVAPLFQVNIGHAVDYEAILKKANEALVNLTLQTQAQATDLVQQNEVLKKQATTDALVGIHNRASFDKFLAEQIEAYCKEKKPLTLVLFDVDNFKSINDRHGHQAGDQVLKEVGEVLNSAAREQDLAARYGGDEMVLVLPATPRAVGASIAETIRRAIAARTVKSSGASPISVTASIGVATAEPGGPVREPAHLLKLADMAVYAAKKAGRNCVKVFATPAAAKPAA